MEEAKVVRFELVNQTSYGTYNVHFKHDTWLYFEVYPVTDWSGPNDTSGTAYISLEDQPDIMMEFEQGKCLMKLKGSYCWRGTWEGRLRFPDSEYWSEELKELSNLFEVWIEPYCKAFLRKVEPTCNE